MTTWSRAITALTATWVSLVSGTALASPAAGDHAHGISLFNWPGTGNPDKRIGIAYLIINFLVLAFLIHRLILRKLISDNQTRHDDIKRQVDEAASALREAQSVIADYKGRVARIDADSKQILDEARAAAAADRQRLQTEAEQEVERFKSSALAAAQREVDTRKAELEREVVDHAIERATEILRARFSDADHNRLVDDYAVDLASRATRT